VISYDPEALYQFLYRYLLMAHSLAILAFTQLDAVMTQVTRQSRFHRDASEASIYHPHVNWFGGKQEYRIKTNRDFTHKPKGPDPVVLFFIGLFIFWGFGYETVGKFLYTQVEGTIVSKRYIPPTKGPRYATEYLLRTPDGNETIYVAGPTDASLPRNMPIGTYLRKQRWSFSYERNGQRVSDFGSLLPFYGVFLSIGFVCLVRSFVLRRRAQHDT
jgi:hypothetical protein